MTKHSAHRPRQPLLHDALVTIAAPTQVWSRHTGDMVLPIDGVYHADVRHMKDIRLTCGHSGIEWIGVTEVPTDVRDDVVVRTVVATGLLRDADNDDADPKLRLERSRTVRPGAIEETYTVISRLADPVELSLGLDVSVDFAPMDQIKDGRLRESSVTVTAEDGSVHAGDGGAECRLVFGGAGVTVDGRSIAARWTMTVPAGGSASVTWSGAMSDPRLVVAPAVSRWTHTPVGPCDPDLVRWTEQAARDLDALRLTLPGGNDEFFAAGAPWFFTLFGRDSLWTARLLLPEHRDIALSTLRVLASMQGTRCDASTAEQPGKILHELRAGALELPQEGLVLPPIYYGSVDSTLLWILLLGDLWRGGAEPEEIRAFIPGLRAALNWMTEYGDGDGDGFIDYIDLTGQGLSNQGWKDSGDSVQWRDGTIAEGPIALCEVQAYAYEAAIVGADILEWAGEKAPGSSPEGLRAWAGDLKERFAEAFWVTTPEGRYPAIALDGHKRAVDTLTSNIGHLLGTGILDHADERHVAELVAGPSMSSGFGIRTMSSGAGGYWPLSYHGGSVWAHDTAIIAVGLERAGLHHQAMDVAHALARTAACFGYRMPELFSGDSAHEVARPAPYPASCRPQAWSAAAAIACAHIALA